MSRAISRGHISIAADANAQDGQSGAEARNRGAQSSRGAESRGNIVSRGGVETRMSTSSEASGLDEASLMVRDIYTCAAIIYGCFSFQHLKIIFNCCLLFFSGFPPLIINKIQQTEAAKNLDSQNKRASAEKN
jgi:hypothetical protein